ncbi:MAG: CRISPR-associated protein Cas4 [Nanoarchaeota archaeon]|nr:CRISPR-associated protein Cas4 [Nanoarchaeota archaeon]
MKKIINITDITGFLYCPRKIYLKLVKGIKSPPTQRMINGMLRHKVFDIFNKNESSLVSSIKSKINQEEIKKLYLNFLHDIIQEILTQNNILAGKFRINEKDFSKSILETMNPEIEMRVKSITTFLEKGFLGKELWRELIPKYLTELKLESQELGLRGRVDRVMFSDSILPYEVKTRDKIYESDKLQLAGYALLLEKEFNKQISKGIVEFLGQQQEIDLTQELKNKVLEIAETIRNLSEENASMPSNFEKCRNCELNENCA